MALIKLKITEEQAQVLEEQDGSLVDACGRKVLLFVQTGCDGILRVCDYEADVVLLECEVQSA